MSQRVSQQFHRKQLDLPQELRKRKPAFSDRALTTKRIVARISIFSHRGIYIQGKT
jgi:hypothetical protein